MTPLAKGGTPIMNWAPEKGDRVQSGPGGASHVPRIPGEGWEGPGRPLGGVLEGKKWGLRRAAGPAWLTAGLG